MASYTGTKTVEESPPKTDKPINSDAFRQVMGSYPTGVVIVTSIDAAGQPLGLVIGSFSSVSLDPPLIAFLPMKTSKTFEAMRASTAFCVNVLAADQEWLCRHFASAKQDKFNGIPWRPAPSGAPILDGAVSWIDCEPHDTHDGGDHHIVLGRVTDLDVSRETLPLMFFQRGYGKFTPSSLVISNGRDYLESVHLAAAARTELELLAGNLGAECTLATVSNTDYVFVASSNQSATAGRSRLGARVPLMPPFGSLLVGSRGAPTEDEWLGRLVNADEAKRAEAKRQLTRVRERGYSICLFGSQTQGDLDDLVNTYMDTDRTPDQERAFLDTVNNTSVAHEPEDADIHDGVDVLHLAVPVHDHNGNVQAVLRLGELPPHASRSEIGRWLALLNEAAGQIELRIAKTLA